MVRTEIDSAMHRYNRFMQAGPPDSLAAMFAEDGDVYDGENALRGRSAIRAFYEPLTRNVRIESATATTRAIESSGTRVLQWGEYVQNASQVGGPVTHFRGRFVAEWERGPEGQWLIRRIVVLPLNSGSVIGAQGGVRVRTGRMRRQTPSASRIPYATDQTLRFAGSPPARCWPLRRRWRARARPRRRRRTVAKADSAAATGGAPVGFRRRHAADAAWQSRPVHRGGAREGRERPAQERCRTARAPNDTFVVVDREPTPS